MEYHIVESEECENIHESDVEDLVLNKILPKIYDAISRSGSMKSVAN
jgi:hypothetical protein